MMRTINLLIFCLIFISLFVPTVYAQTGNYVDILWEAQTYTPPWYHGKALYIPRSSVTFMAVPNITGSDGTQYTSDELVFQWTRGGYDLIAQRGRGVDVVAIPLSPLRPEDVGVRIETLTGEVLAETEVTLRPTQEELVVYVQDPLLGVQYHTAITGSHTIANNEATFLATPFYFNTSRMLDGTVSYTWELNNTQLTTSGNSETFRQEPGAQGTANLSIEARHREHSIEKAVSEFITSFGDR